MHSLNFFSTAEITGIKPPRWQLEKTFKIAVGLIVANTMSYGILFIIPIRL